MPHETAGNPREWWYTVLNMAGMQSEHGVQGSRPTQAVLRCIVFGPRDHPTPADLQHSLEARGSTITRADDQYNALAALIELEQAGDDPEQASRPGPIALLLLEPQQHADRCAQLAQAAQIYAPRAVIWQHSPTQRPSLSAYLPPKPPDETEHIEQARQAARAEETPYERAARSTAAPTLRLVIDDEADAPGRSHQPESEEDGDSLLSAEEIEMLMDPLFESKPRRGEPR